MEDPGAGIPKGEVQIGTGPLSLAGLDLAGREPQVAVGLQRAHAQLFSNVPLRG
jgi:hypothetical protein